MRISLAGETIELRPERALYWPARRALLVADLHVGKAETFQRHGIPVPTGQGAADVARLSELLSRTGAERLFVLGDLVHGRDVPHEPLTRLRAAHPNVEFHLVRGNHEHWLPRLPEPWGFVEHRDALAMPPFVLRHDPRPDPSGYVLAGHLHPVVELEAAGDALRLPCFWLGDTVGLLPAFTEFSSGVRVDRTKARTYVLAEGEVIEV